MKRNVRLSIVLSEVNFSVQKDVVTNLFRDQPTSILHVISAECQVQTNINLHRSQTNQVIIQLALVFTNSPYWFSFEDLHRMSSDIELTDIPLPNFFFEKLIYAFQN